jgi:hypothetical protein
MSGGGGWDWERSTSPLPTTRDWGRPVSPLPPSARDWRTAIQTPLNYREDSSAVVLTCLRYFVLLLCRAGDQITFLNHPVSRSSSIFEPKTSLAEPDPGSGAFLTPGSGAFLTPGSGIRDGKKLCSGIWKEHPRSFFRELRNSVLG